MISIVIPICNEEESLAILQKEITDVARRTDLHVEVHYIDDGSTDKSWSVLRDLARAQNWVHGIRLRRNFGKAAALSAGFQAARGDIVLTMDGDLQDDPSEIPSFIAALEKGLDVVSGWKRVRHDPWHKVLPSRIFNFMVSLVTG